MHPVLVRHITYPYFQWRRRSRAAERLGELERTEWLPPARLRDMQWKRVSGLLKHVHSHVPYYRTMFRDLGAHPDDFRSLDDVKRLPVLRKEVVRDQGRELIAEGVVDLRRRLTSGSTGIPMRTFIDGRCWDWWRAAERRSWRRWGVDTGDRSASFTTAPVHRVQARKRAFLLNEGTFQYGDLSEASLAAILRQLARFRPAFLCGLPTVLARLARFVRDDPRVADEWSLKAIFSTGEVLYPDQRAVMTQAFQCPVVNEYSASETWLMAAECPHGRMHINAENVYLEFRPVAPNASGLSEILVTDLHNWGMPFLRYAIGDVGSPLEERCPCGRGLPLLDLNAGRVADLAVLPDGRIVEDSVFCRIFETAGVGRLRQFRIVQETLDRFTVWLAVDRDDGLVDTVQSGFRQILGPGARVDIRIVTEIPPEPSGKLRSFVSRLQHPAVRHPEPTTASFR